MFFYNKTLLDQAQVAPEEIQSFDDLLAASKKVCALGDDIFGFALPSSGVMPGEGYHVLPVLWANGGDLLDAEGKIAVAGLFACAGGCSKQSAARFGCFDTRFC